MINCDKENDKNSMHLYTVNLKNWTHGKHTKPCKKGYCPITLYLTFNFKYRTLRIKIELGVFFISICAINAYPYWALIQRI